MTIAEAAAFRFVREHGIKVGLFARISAASNGIYAANAPVYTFAPADEQQIYPLAEVGANWTCVGMVYPL